LDARIATRTKYMSNVMFVHIESLAEMKQLESNFLSKVLNTACESKNQDNNSGTTSSSKSKSRKTSSSKAPKSEKTNFKQT